MQQNITYIIGAGASCNALPVVDKFSEELQYVIDELEKVCTHLRMGFTSLNGNNYVTALNNLKKLLQGCKNHASVDTYAKMLFLTKNEKEYRESKLTISLFFELFRYYKRQFDKRYDAFFASILNRDEPRFPSHINFISWNYDYEFEKAFLKYSQTKDIGTIHEELNVVHKNGQNNLKQTFNVIKVNGTTGYFNEQGKLTLGLGNIDLYVYDSPSDPQRLNPIIENYNNVLFDYTINPGISFAWEDGSEQQGILTAIQSIMMKTQIVVIIGYSFPYFNRQVDRQIFSYFKDYPASKVFIQDPYAEDILESVISLKNNWGQGKIIPIKNLRQFYLPQEM